MADKLRLGFVGANVRSAWSTQSHFPALLASPDVEMRAVCTTRPESAEEAREAFGAKRYDDMITRLRLKQAFGRLVRRADDTGVFVLLDPMMPSRLAGAFPEGVEMQRVGLAEAVRVTRGFLNPG